MSKTIGILGCGWLGKPLALQLLRQGHVVKGTTTSIDKLEELRSLGIDPYMVELKENVIDGGIKEFLTNLEILIINIPPGLRANPNSAFPARLQMLVRSINEYTSLDKLLYVSSTAVFQGMPAIPTYNERSTTNATDPKGRQLITAEEVMRKANTTTTIIRPGGLIGADRHPVKFLAGKQNIANPDAPVNLTSQETLIRVISTWIDLRRDPAILHVISEPHVSRKIYYTKKALEMNLEPPGFKDGKSIGKCIASTIL
jgi:nucleoside-diphosphate-sugar epimerase